MTPKERLLLRLCVAGYALAFVGSAVLLSLYGERIGLERGPGTWLWAGAMTALAGLLFGPFIARRTGWGRALTLMGLVLAAGVGVYAYVAVFMVPGAVDVAAEANPAEKPTADPGPPGRRWAE